MVALEKESGDCQIHKGSSYGDHEGLYKIEPRRSLLVSTNQSALKAVDEHCHSYKDAASGTKTPKVLQFQLFNYEDSQNHSFVPKGFTYPLFIAQ